MLSGAFVGWRITARPEQCFDARFISPIEFGIQLRLRQFIHHHFYFYSRTTPQDEIAHLVFISADRYDLVPQANPDGPRIR